MITRRNLLKRTGGAVLAAALPPLACAEAAPSAGLTLKAAAAKAGLRFGSSSDVPVATTSDTYRSLFLEQCELLAPIMSWSFVAPRRDGADPASEDPNLRFGFEHHLAITGAHLLWHERVPSWFGQIADSTSAQGAALGHIRAMTDRYRGKILSWNVVNEALQPRDGRPDGLRNSPLLAKLGPDFFDIAFRTARKGDPDAFLVYNDYGLEMDKPDHEKKRTALLRLLDRFAEDGTPIDAVGLQSHLALDGARFDEKLYRGFLHELASRNLKIIISELDVLDKTVTGDFAARDQAVADFYARFLAVALDETAVVAVVNWGLSDKFTWLTPQTEPSFARPDGKPARPLAFDDAFAPKPAFDAIRTAFEHAPPRPQTKWNAPPSVK